MAQIASNSAKDHKLFELRPNKKISFKWIIVLEAAADLQLYQKIGSGTSVFLWILQNF